MRAWWLFSSQAIITHILAQLPCHVLALPRWEADFFFNRSHTWKWLAFCRSPTPFYPRWILEP